MKKHTLFKAFAICSILFSTPVALVSCGLPEFVDIAGTTDVVKLQLDYKDQNGNNRDFFKDGISQVTLKTSIDGDTSHFYPVGSKGLIKSRYYGIDTPESTGKIEPYGKEASNFTKEKLTNASENGTIVVTSTCIDEYKVPETDSTGTRYLSLVWVNETVKDAPFDSLVCLNLWIVQEGLSYVKNLEKLPAYKDVFLQAEDQAKLHKLNLFSGKDAPLFNYGEYIDASLVEMKEEVVASLKDPDYVNKFEGANVRVQGTVAGFTDNILYLQQKIVDKDTGEETYGGINVFCGMTQPPSKYTQKNAYIQLCGNAQTSENFGFQITGVPNFPKVPPKDETDSKVLYKPSETPEELIAHDVVISDPKELDTNYDLLFRGVEFTQELYVEHAYDSAGEPKKITLDVTTTNGVKNNFKVYVPFLFKPDPNNPAYLYRNAEDYVGHTLKVKGMYTFHKHDDKIEFQIIPRVQEDLTFIK